MQHNQHGRLLVLNGASCAGKTTTAKTLVRIEPRINWIHPDGIWPDTSQVGAEVIFERVLDRVADIRDPLIIVDCQIRPSSLAVMAEQVGMHIESLLLHCGRALREDRMRERGWLAIDFARIHSWAEVLLEETECAGHPMLETSANTPDAVATAVLVHLRALGWLSP